MRAPTRLVDETRRCWKLRIPVRFGAVMDYNPTLLPQSRKNVQKDFDEIAGG
jgi:hypothetical protein